PGTPLAGYGGMKRRLLFPDLFGRYAHAFWFKPSVGERDPMTVRALVLETPAARLTWVTLDVIAVDRALVGVVEDRLARAGVPAPAVTASRLGKPLDQEIVVLKLTTLAGAPLALVWNFAIHGTMLSANDLRLSGDVMGLASARLERTLGAPALFVNGAVGDVSPARHGEAAMVETAGALASTVAAGWTRARPVPVTT